MTLNIKKLISLFAIVLTVQLGYSQLDFSHEIGVIVGPTAYKSDFGERYDFETNSGNIGFGVGIVYYMNFDYLTNYHYFSRKTYFKDHFKVRGEISYNQTTLNHYGRWVDKDQVGPSADKLRAHSGEAQNWNVGAQLEYYPRSIKGFSQGAFGFTPFASFGFQFVAFNSTVNTTYGDQNPNNVHNFYPHWEPGSIANKSGSTWSMVGSVGVRYKLTILSDLMLDFRVQSYFNDWTDGLNHQLSSNKSTDSLVWLNFGYIYYFD